MFVRNLAGAFVFAIALTADVFAATIGTVFDVGYATYQSPYTITAGPKTGTVGAGLMGLNGSGGTNDFLTSFRHVGDSQGNDKNLVAGFCIDLSEYIYSAQHPFKVEYLQYAPNDYGSGSSLHMGPDKAEAISRLWGNVLGTGNEYIVASNKTMALQLAFWEIIYEAWNPSTWNLYNGSFKASGTYSGSDVRGLANTYLTELATAIGNNYSGYSQRANLVALSAPDGYGVPSGYQDQVVQWLSPTAPSRPTPEPSSIVALASIGIVGLGALARRKQRAAR